MKNKLELKSISASNNRIEYSYIIEGDWVKYFNLSNNFYVEYEEDITRVPDSLKIVPLLSNILPMIWIFDADVYFDTIDKTFYESLSDVKQGYINMYPELEFKGRLHFSSIEGNTSPISVLERSNACYFTGGVDAFSTLLSHKENIKYTITIWGADIDAENISAWDTVKNGIIDISSTMNFCPLFIKSNFRNSIREDRLSSYVAPLVQDGWWHGFHHGIGMFGLSAPIAYKHGISIVYIASSFTPEAKAIERITSASDPTIDNYFKYADTTFSHDGYEMGRTDKIENIVKFSIKNNQDIPLRVCWESKDGKNCNKCEKCYRTILGILVQGEDPNNYGFDYDISRTTRMMRELKYKFYTRESTYIDLQNKFRANYEISEIPRSLIEFYNMDLTKINSNFIKRTYNMLRSIKIKLGNIYRKYKK